MTKRVFLDFWISDSSNPCIPWRPSLDLAFHVFFWLHSVFHLFQPLMPPGLVRSPVWRLTPDALILFHHCRILVQTLYQPGAGATPALGILFRTGNQYNGRKRVRRAHSLLRKHLCTSYCLRVQCKIKALGIRRPPSVQILVWVLREIYLIFLNLTYLIYQMKIISKGWIKTLW